jgi:hypothetical protein
MSLDEVRAGFERTDFDREEFLTAALPREARG